MLFEQILSDNALEFLRSASDGEKFSRFGRGVEEQCQCIGQQANPITEISMQVNNLIVHSGIDVDV